MAFQTLLTPKDLASAIGASESSLRRWIDSGDIRVSRTAGGHRRIPLNEAVQFVRKIGAQVIRPEILGLGLLHEVSSGDSGAADNAGLFEALHAGDRNTARSIMLSWYLDGRSLPALFDGPVCLAMHRLGELWKHDERGILIEHRATEICLAVLAELRGLLAEPHAEAPLAMGGAPQGDPYLIPTSMASLTLQDAGLRTISFGANTPVELLGEEAVAQGARLVWLSISATQDEKVLRPAIRQLAGLLGQHTIEFVLGGMGALNCRPQGVSKVQLIGSMGELAGFARGIQSSQPADSSS